MFRSTEAEYLRFKSTKDLFSFTFLSKHHAWYLCFYISYLFLHFHWIIFLLPSVKIWGGFSAKSMLDLFWIRIIALKSIFHTWLSPSLNVKIINAREPLEPESDPINYCDFLKNHKTSCRIQTRRKKIRYVTACFLTELLKVRIQVSIFYRVQIPDLKSWYHTFRFVFANMINDETPA